jgi:hypothetical protein
LRLNQPLHVFGRGNQALTVRLRGADAARACEDQSLDLGQRIYGGSTRRFQPG